MRSVKHSPAPMRSAWPIRAAVLCLLLPAAQAETDPAAAAVPGMAASATSAPAALPTTPIAPPAPPSAVREQVPTEPMVVAPPAPVAPKAITVAPPKPLSAAALAARPAWTELTPSQQQALGPWAGRWTEISEQQRRIPAAVQAGNGSTQRPHGHAKSIFHGASPFRPRRCPPTPAGCAARWHRWRPR